MRLIDLTQGKKAIVDDDDYERIINLDIAWYAIQHKSNGDKYSWYAHGSDGQEKKYLLHRLILDAPEGTIVDHKNGNGLDNRKKNLRLASHAQNMANRKKHKNNKTGYKGVWWESHAQKYRVRLHKNNKSISVGYFNDLKEAAIAYNEAAHEHFGEFARLNEI